MSNEQERNELEQRISLAEGKEKHYADQMKILKREHSQLERKRRNHRIFTRGAMLETFLLKPLLLTDEQVFKLLKTAFNSPEIRTQETVYIKETICGTSHEMSYEKLDSE